MDYSRFSPYRWHLKVSGPLGLPAPTTYTQSYQDQARSPHTKSQFIAPTVFAWIQSKTKLPLRSFSEPEARFERCSFCNSFQQLHGGLSVTESSASAIWNTDRPGQIMPLNRIKPASHATPWVCVSRFIQGEGERGGEKKSWSQHLMNMLIPPFCSLHLADFCLQNDSRL